MTAPELKPCPFCGGEAELNDCLVGCGFCLCSVPDGVGYEGERLGYATEAEAISAWNTRALDPAQIRADGPLNENGDLIGHPLEMQMRAEWRKVAKHHDLPSDGVVEADFVRAILALIDKPKGGAE